MNVKYLKSKIDIIEVVEKYTVIYKVGKDCRCKCILHKDSNPSMHIYVDNTWYCFGCRRGGDVISFVQLVENINFTEACKLLAQQYNINISISGGDYKPYNIVYPLALDGTWHDYLRRRRISDTTINQWGLGYDCNTSSICIPIRNSFGATIAHAYRYIGHNNTISKYRNANGNVYNKSSTLFGLDKAKKYIDTSNYCIIVEGYFDCISLHQAGIRNVVAICGVALTQQMIDIIKRHTKNVVFCYDNDTAGINATVDSITKSIGQDFCIKVLEVCDYHDIDELVVGSTPEQLHKFLCSKIHWIDFMYKNMPQNIIQCLCSVGDISYMIGCVDRLSEISNVSADIIFCKMIKKINKTSRLYSDFVKFIKNGGING